MIDPDLSCKDETRREAVRKAALFGLDFVEVSDNQRTLTVFFLGKLPPKIEKANIVITGGKRITGIQVTSVHANRRKDPALDDSLEVHVDKAGDFSEYTLSAVKLDDRGRPTGRPMDGFDPRYSQVTIEFKASCPPGLDCKTPRVCPPDLKPQPEIDYLAKDYESFRQLILDRLALTIPGWRETHVPDIGITLVELMAYVGDYLSYYQDAVATEAYLGTARQRISVRRHARLVDYAMHEGCNARAWVTLHTDRDQQFDDVAQVYFITAFPNAPGNHVLTPVDLEGVPPQSYDVFQPLVPSGGKLWIWAAHSDISFYTWGDAMCCLAKGATAAALVDKWVPKSEPPPGKQYPPAPPAADASDSVAVPGSGGDGPPGTVRMLKLKVGDVLIFEEVLGPKTGNPADADPAHRQAVRLTRVTPAIDTLYRSNSDNYGRPIVEIEWAAEDALRFPLCLSSRMPAPDCSPMIDVTIAHGNVVLVDHGGNTTETVGTVPTKSSTPNCPSVCCPPDAQYIAGWFRPTLGQRPLTFSQPISPGACSAAEIIVQFARQALPNIVLDAIPAAPDPQSDGSVPPLFTFDDLANPTALAKVLKDHAGANLEFLWARLSPATQQQIRAYDGTGPLPPNLKAALIADLAALLDKWYPVRDLLESGGNDPCFVAEMDDDGYAHLRFGDGSLGRAPEAGTQFRAAYRAGNGAAGNVGAETITYMVLRQEKLSGVTILPRNPMAAMGGVDPEPVKEVKLFAPYAFRDVLERAITGDDYAALAADNDRRLAERPVPEKGKCEAPFVKLQAAKGTLRWNGSWFEAMVALDPEHAESDSPELLREVRRYLEPYRRIGQDLSVHPAEYVPLELALSVCVMPDYLRGQVEAALLDVFSSGVTAGGSKGFFHPDNLTFGEGIAVSRIIAAAQAVPGVAAVSVKRFERYRVEPKTPYRTVAEDPDDVPPTGVLTLGPYEIAQLDNDPSFPENGRLELTLRGGR